MPADQFLNALERMAAEAPKNRRKNLIVKALRVFQVLAVILLAFGLIGLKVSDRGDEKLMGLAVAGVGLIGILIVEGIARGMGRLN